MTAVFEIEKTLAVKRKRFTTNEFQEMVKAGILPEEHGWEVIDGFLMDKIRVETKNAGTVKRLNYIFNNRFGKNLIVSVRNPIHLNKYNEPEPDIALLKWRNDFYTESHPLPDDVLLLIEVSDSTIEYDREVKKKLYAQFGIQEYWVVNLKDNFVETFSQPKNGGYRLAKILESDEVVKSTVISGLELTAKEILGL